MNSAPRRLVIFGVSNILWDLFDAALACGMAPTKVVIHHPEQPGDRDLPVATRLAALARCCPGSAPPALSSLDDFVPEVGEAYLLGPTTTTRAHLAALLQDRFGLEFCTLVHPRAYVSPLAALVPGVFVRANSVIAPGVHLDTHVFVNRGATVGHDTRVGAFTRIQPGPNLGGLSRVGAGVTIALGPRSSRDSRSAKDPWSQPVPSYCRTCPPGRWLPACRLRYASSWPATSKCRHRAAREPRPRRPRFPEGQVRNPCRAYGPACSGRCPRPRVRSRRTEAASR
jgi:hypothetical protein